jgi:hypothetical protein
MKTLTASIMLCIVAICWSISPAINAAPVPQVTPDCCSPVVDADDIVNKLGLNLSVPTATDVTIYNVPPGKWLVITHFNGFFLGLPTDLNLLEDISGVDTLKMNDKIFSPEESFPTGLAFEPGSKVQVNHGGTGTQNLHYKFTGYLWKP